jgi:hypothetical protein
VKELLMQVFTQIKTNLENIRKEVLMQAQKDKKKE